MGKCRQTKMKVVAFLALLFTLSCATNTVLDALREDGRFTTALKALETTHLDWVLQKPTSDEPITIFAPTDDAFEKLGVSSVLLWSMMLRPSPRLFFSTLSPVPSSTLNLRKGKSCPPLTNLPRSACTTLAALGF